MIDEVKTLVDLVQAGGFIGILTILAIPKARRILGFDGGITPEQLKEALMDNSSDHPALLARIPLLCTEQIKIRENIEKLDDKIDHLQIDMAFIRAKIDV